MSLETSHQPTPSSNQGKALISKKPTSRTDQLKSELKKARAIKWWVDLKRKMGFLQYIGDFAGCTCTSRIKTTPACWMQYPTLCEWTSKTDAEGITIDKWCVRKIHFQRVMECGPLDEKGNLLSICPIARERANRQKEETRPCHEIVLKHGEPDYLRVERELASGRTEWDKSQDPKEFPHELVVLVGNLEALCYWCTNPDKAKEFEKAKIEEKKWKDEKEMGIEPTEQDPKGSFLENSSDSEDDDKLGRIPQKLEFVDFEHGKPPTA